jgi:hypothetical protein
MLFFRGIISAIRPIMASCSGTSASTDHGMASVVVGAGVELQHLIDLPSIICTCFAPSNGADGEIYLELQFLEFPGF